jgi:hypothetical protein
MEEGEAMELRLMQDIYVANEVRQQLTELTPVFKKWIRVQKSYNDRHMIDDDGSGCPVQAKLERGFLSRAGQAVGPQDCFSHRRRQIEQNKVRLRIQVVFA